MKNSTQRGAPMPGSRSQLQFRGARLRRVTFHWRHRQGDTPAAATDEPRGKG
ncbi:hypothetical protein [Bordetella trematum]|uniref:hypothetical protein n=1 Tax=Bordetella trematum TaxID=123899 RepID=UPI0004B29E94|nr:hypothetical protein [Bordetella trematum]NNH18912.1 hypothetical protein [Bordetella trematum]